MIFWVKIICYRGNDINCFFDCQLVIGEQLIINIIIFSFWKVGKELLQDRNYVFIDVFIFENDVKWNLKSEYYYFK